MRNSVDRGQLILARLMQIPNNSDELPALISICRIAIFHIISFDSQGSHVYDLDKNLIFPYSIYDSELSPDS